MGSLLDAALRAAKLERAKRMQVESWRKDPMLWLKERFKEDPADYEWDLFPEYVGHKWDGDRNPLAGAWKAIAQGEWAGIESCTGSGKTFSLSRIVFWYLDVYEDSLVVTSAPKQAQLTLNLWAEIGKAFYKFKRIRPYAQLYKLRLVVEDKENKGNDYDPEEQDLSDSWQAIGFIAGVGSEEQSATKAQGFHRKDMLIITEETPGMPEAVLTAFTNTSIGENNQILAVGNPDSQLDPLHTFCALPNVRTFRISAYDHPNVVKKHEYIPGAVTQKSIDRRLATYGLKSSMYQSRVRGISPSQGTDSLIQLSWLEKAAETKIPYDNTYHAVGVDVANSSDGDKAALAWGEGPILKSLHEFACDNATHLAYNLYMDSAQLEANGYTDYNTAKLSDYEIMNGMIGVDSVGVGAATINALMDADLNPVALFGGQWADVIPIEVITMPDGTQEEKPLYKFQTLRTQMYWELREDLRKGLLDFTAITEDATQMRLIFKELTSIRVTYKDGVIAVERKEEIKKRLGGKSPNKADCIAYWNWTRKGYRFFHTDMPIIGG